MSDSTGDGHKQLVLPLHDQLSESQLAYDVWEASQPISPASPEAWWAEKAWHASRGFEWPERGGNV